MCVPSVRLRKPRCAGFSAIRTAKIFNPVDEDDHPSHTLRREGSSQLSCRNHLPGTFFGGPMSGVGPGRVKTFFLPQKLHAAGRNPRRRDRLSLFLLYRVRSQSGRTPVSNWRSVSEGSLEAPGPNAVSSMKLPRSSGLDHFGRLKTSSRPRPN
jgi:hypothetical protein